MFFIKKGDFLTPNPFKNVNRLTRHCLQAAMGTKPELMKPKPGHIKKTKPAS